MRSLIASTVSALILLASPAPTHAEAIRPVSTVHLFNGRDLGGFYTFLKGRGRDTDPENVFTVRDGMLRISGTEWGCVTSTEEYRDYKLVAEFRWGEATHGTRSDSARDSGLLVNSRGEDGGHGGIWMHGIEVQIIEGGTGDLLVVGDRTKDFELTSPVAAQRQGSSPVFEPGGQPATLNSGRVNWWGRDPQWADRKDFRGARDVEHPRGEWNTLECLVHGDTLKVWLNGKLVNEASGVKPAAGRIQIQSEGAEIFFRRFDLLPLSDDR